MSESKVELVDRLRREGRWSEASQFKDQVLRGLREEGMKRNEAGDEAWRQMAEQFPPLPEEEAAAASISVRVRGLGGLPDGWPDLPPNASLQAEIGWVQAYRLDMIEDTPGGATVVHLDRAGEPAPSKAAIGWLETSIRTFVKFIDVAAKVTAQQADEQDQVRRERMQIAEIEELLREMHED